MMLSNPTTSLQTRQRQHRRQYSTPTAFETVKASNLPNIQRNGAHRRGMSLDTRRQQTVQQDLRVSITNNPGYQSTQQHILLEAQQQSLSRPGQQYSNYGNDENYLCSPLITPQRQSFDTGCTSQFEDTGQGSQNFYSGQINATNNVNTANFSCGNDFGLFSSDGSLTPSAFLDFSGGFDEMNDGGVSNNGNSSRRSSGGRHISGGILSRVNQFENLAPQTQHRPKTPPNQNATSYFPLTPSETPHERMSKHQPVLQRFQEDYDMSMEETIKPKANQRARGVFEDMRKDAEMKSMPSPPRTGPMPSCNSFDSAPILTANFMNMSNLNLDFLRNEQHIDGSLYSPVSSNVSPEVSYHSSPEMTHASLFGDPFNNKPELEAPEMLYPDPESLAPSSPKKPSSANTHRRTESTSTVNLDESITDTGITIDDIATFISGPEPADAKWVCLYPECNKRFGRKENIKSHVQTHLGDRQFQCPHCKKCFVRQHDLKRHAKIHSGVKPYPCQCGNSFARHDALTRHRQRGMCIGAFEGIVKKTVKRGRPRKNRPDTEERIKKSSRTRSKNKAMSSASSTTGYTESYSGNSPRSDLDDILDDKPFGDYSYTQTSHMNTNSFPFEQLHSPIPDVGVSPQAIQTSHSPSALSTHSMEHYHIISPSATQSQSHINLPFNAGSPAKSVHSNSHQSPPDLCTSSSPAASTTNYFDLEDVNGHGGSLSLSNLSALETMSEHDDEMFLEAFAHAGHHESGGLNMTRLELCPEMLLGKLEDEFTVQGTEDIFKCAGDTGDDVFFGSP